MTRDVSGSESELSDAWFDEPRPNPPWDNNDDPCVVNDEETRNPLPMVFNFHEGKCEWEVYIGEDVEEAVSGEPFAVVNPEGVCDLQEWNEEVGVDP